MWRPEYLFIRILEACNANCFMCGFARSKDQFRFEANTLQHFLPRVKEEGIRYIRLTGGEPLLHKELSAILLAIGRHGLKSSLITNGALLKKRLQMLVDSGLDQVIVSLDGGCADTHDKIRDTSKLFERAVEGLEAARDAGILTRVNTVCGPLNFREMPLLQDLLTKRGVGQWELSSLKLNGKLNYTEQDKADIPAIIRYVYNDAVAGNRLIPMGKIWCGNTEKERARYFNEGITPRPDQECLLVKKVRYFDAKERMLYPCSLLPHRLEASKTGVRIDNDQEMSVMTDKMKIQVGIFQVTGPQKCTGCSTTAAGWSNDLSEGIPVSDWSF